MVTKTFSSRADKDQLTYADELSRREYGLSYGQYCGTILLDAIERTGRMPDLADGEDRDRAQKAAAFIKGFSQRGNNAEIAAMSDDEIRQLIAGRYA